MRNRRSVALLIETSNAYARGLLAGITAYVVRPEVDGPHTSSRPRPLPYRPGRAAACETDHSLERIAALAGFDHPEYMSVAFKRETGTTPGKVLQLAHRSDPLDTAANG